MEAPELEISDLRIWLRALKDVSDLQQRNQILAKIAALGDRSVQLVPDLIAAIKRHIYFSSTALVPVIINSKSAELLDIALDQNHGRWPLNTFECCDLLRAGFNQFQQGLLDELIEVFDNDSEPCRSAIVEALADSGTVSSLETLNVIECRTAAKIRELANESVEDDAADPLKRFYLEARTKFLETVRRAIPLVKTRPDPVANAEGTVVAEHSEPVIAHVLFLDIVDFSKESMCHQKEVYNQLGRLVEDLAIVKRYQQQNKLTIRPTGDGMALVFFGEEVKPHVDAAIELHKAFEPPNQIKLRAGIHTGPVHRVIDINQQLDVSGDGIILAQRVMDCGDAGHILLSDQVARILMVLGGWDNSLTNLGLVKVKHDVTVGLFNLTGEGFGNPAQPKKLAKSPKPRFDLQTDDTVAFNQEYPSQEIVRAWFNDAINPQIENLKYEEKALESQLWTWDHKINGFKDLNFTYIPSSFEANEEDFLDRYPHIVELLKLHDARLTSLNDRGKALFRELTQSSSFHAAFSDASDASALLQLRDEHPAFKDRDPAGIVAELFSGQSDESVIAWLSEFAMNGRTLENYWCMAPFWNRNRKTFIELVPRCVSYWAVLEARKELLEVIREMITTLKAERKALSSRYGVPPESAPRKAEDPVTSFGFWSPRK